jgi:arsenite methyltransferase
MTKRVDYGVDAPNVIRNLFLGGAAFLIVALLLPQVTLGGVTFVLFPGFLYPAAGMILGAGLMLLYGKVGKFRHRDRMLARVPWAGTEQVLDVGTGRGLLLIGAAKRLTTGHATGIDIWNKEDLSNNGPQGLLENIGLEGVGDRTTVKSENAREMSFADGTFDVVLSNLCLHNIYNRPGRAEACREIARVLKPGAVAVISDYKHMRQYAKVLRQAGLTVQLGSPDWLRTYPPLRILTARKSSDPR